MFRMFDLHVKTWIAFPIKPIDDGMVARHAMGHNKRAIKMSST